MNNKSSSSTVHYNSVRRFLYFVDCAQSRLSAQDLYLQFLLRRSPPEGLPRASLLKQKVYYFSQNRNDTDNKDINVKQYSCFIDTKVIRVAATARLKNFVP